MQNVIQGPFGPEWRHRHEDGVIHVHPGGFECTLGVAACKHENEWPRGTVWPRQASLDHFENCINSEDRLIRWTLLLERAEQNDDYEGRIAALLQQIDHKDSTIKRLKKGRNR